eukprot:NODE_4431_length_1169_cov_41.514340_g3916_i0.p1 GENE.NODE_4431_length_1169_cov_41.514340_g3916_i0~~NODE_4431_length_1169_cov_41.514340_g3916_i0.p1  ORF type:complete len:349 (-),score=92.49 NODE_4431_length_1169_cov_41.514340_g3916_i0:122-1132(-)
MRAATRCTELLQSLSETAADVDYIKETYRVRMEPYQLDKDEERVLRGIKAREAMKKKNGMLRVTGRINTKVQYERALSSEMERINERIQNLNDTITDLESKIESMEDNKERDQLRQDLENTVAQLRMEEQLKIIVGSYSHRPSVSEESFFTPKRKDTSGSPKRDFFSSPTLPGVKNKLSFDDKPQSSSAAFRRVKSEHLPVVIADNEIHDRKHSLHLQEIKKKGPHLPPNITCVVDTRRTLPIITVFDATHLPQNQRIPIKSNATSEEASPNSTMTSPPKQRVPKPPKKKLKASSFHGSSGKRPYIRPPSKGIKTQCPVDTFVSSSLAFLAAFPPQ